MAWGQLLPRAEGCGEWPAQPWREAAGGLAPRRGGVASLSIRRPRKEGLGGPRARAASRPQPRTGQGVEADAPGSAASRARGKRDGCRPHRPALTSRVLGFRGCSRPGAGASRDHAAEKGAHGRCPLVRSHRLAGSIRTAPQQPGRALLATDLQGGRSICCRLGGQGGTALGARPPRHPLRGPGWAGRRGSGGSSAAVPARAAGRRPPPAMASAPCMPRWWADGPRV